jgi:GNAT superfamily N-acetyltransferase
MHVRSLDGTASGALRFPRGYRGADMIDKATMRWLLLHEARIHAIPGRDLRDLGDAILLHDAQEAEPFWNRIEGLAWPSDPSAFDKRLTEILVLFASLGRTPHIWASPLHDSPVDLVARLEANGFRDLGSSHLMLLSDTAPAHDGAEAELPKNVTLERLSTVEPGDVGDAVIAIANVLVDAFDVEPERATGIQGETASSLRHPWFTHYLARIDGVPASVARRATFEGATYLSSIGTSGWARGRGLGSLVTRAAVADARAAGSRWTYLGVFADNPTAIGIYERAGFEQLGGAAPDLLLA